MQRRGFLGLLGGIVLGKVLGPIQIAAPTPELVTAIPTLPLPPLRNYYVPLEVVCAETLAVLDRELKWLRMKRADPPRYEEGRFGDTVWIREREVLRPALSFDPWRSPEMCERARLLNLIGAAHVDLDLSEHRMDCSRGGLYSAHHIEPAAYALAEGMIREIRHLGGGEYLASVKQRVPPDMNRSLVMTSEETGLSVRAYEPIHPLEPGEWYRPKLRIDTLFGVA